MDNCCYNRPFDDLSIGKNGLETSAKMFMQSLVKYNSVSLCYSFISLYEIDASPLDENKKHIQNFIVRNAGIYVSKTHYDKTEIFITNIKNSGFDYTEWRENLWEDLSLSELLQKAADYETAHPELVSKNAQII